MRVPWKEIPGIQEQIVQIVPAPAIDGVSFVLLDAKGDVKATSMSPRWLSDCALWCSHAKEVQWNFDLKLAEGII